MTKRQAQKAATRAKLLATAKTLFDQNGYEATTIRDIAFISGMSTGSFFASWPSKAEIYREIRGHEPVSPEHGRALLKALREARRALDVAMRANCDLPGFDPAETVVMQAVDAALAPFTAEAPAPTLAEAA